MALAATYSRTLRQQPHELSECNLLFELYFEIFLNFITRKTLEHCLEGPRLFYNKRCATSQALSRSTDRFRLPIMEIGSRALWNDEV